MTEQEKNHNTQKRNRFGENEKSSLRKTEIYKNELETTLSHKPIKFPFTLIVSVCNQVHAIQ